MVYFDRRDSRCKTPPGANAAGSKINFTIYVENSLDITHVNLKLRGKKELCVKLLPTQQFLDNRRAFCGAATAPEPGLYFYRFELCHPDGSMHFCGTKEGYKATVGDWLGEWPLTTYAPNFSCPLKEAGAVMYQIFPDRFYRADTDIMEIKGRYLHPQFSGRPHSFYDTPGYKANDYFGGNLKGIIQKLDYIKGLGVTHIYLNPIFESAENHRYSTGDYLKVDPYLGSNADFEALAEAAKKRGIRLVLDGVFSHTGADSKYFNRYNNYNSIGAYNSKNSPYYSWYKFKNWPNDYSCWWGFKTLPETNELSEGFLNFICGPGGVLEYWQQKGAGGWRFDVADELPDEFIEAARRRIKAVDPGALFIGEVWENAVTKESMGHRRSYLLGSQFDSVMNYPWRSAIIELVKDKDIDKFYSAVDEIVYSYPAPALNSLMTPLSTHDTVRIINALAFDNIPPRQKQPYIELTPEQYNLGKTLLYQCVPLQFMLPGMPSIFYGDECGLCGFDDPYCRAPMPWDKPDNEIYNLYKSLGNIRREFKSEFSSPLKFDKKQAGLVSFTRGRLRLTINLAAPAYAVNNPLCGYKLENNRLFAGGFAITIT